MARVSGQVNTELDDDVGAPITLIQNWNPAATQ
jgi:hypothetical protein